MAHSNRQQLKDARGGMTKNQARKSQKSSGVSNGSSRLQETVNWLAQLEEKRKRVTESRSPAEVKITKFVKDKMTIQRRLRVIKRLEAQLLSGVKTSVWLGEPLENVLTDADRVRINKEIKTLKERT